ncbi:MarR family transcriptional regulator [Kitasatospora sp. YST-16]|uniref:MarR family winged helix-turn-helix transcriptional regulator n=1 Tax=Kitasatospora sp. YST-16 TaxID=2998080 RepID=UPI0022842573|nr:MarR family transcriptional regulator [Kitasatospora sp. YST-16]WAL70382.1 MarR family transcriptional regulator [Kitasatospora sp. YST-16]WNW36423.1 MarR family transcriptional regulator [Streptomyces sp. Li-HN-5-13]
MEYTSADGPAGAATAGSPAPSADLVALFADLVRCETRLYNGLGERLRERHGIVTSQYEFLHYLHEHPGCRVADLAAEFAIGVGATSKGVDRLEKQGWAARQPNPDDRRSSLLVLTPAGEQLAAEAGRTFTEALAELLGTDLDAPALDGLARALSTLRADLERDRTGTPAG